MALKQRELARPAKHRSDVYAIRELIVTIDELVCDALGVGDRGREMLQRLFAGYQRPGLEWSRYSDPMEEAPTASNGRTWPVTGQVVWMDAENNTLAMWGEGLQR